MKFQIVFHLQIHLRRMYCQTIRNCNSMDSPPLKLCKHSPTIILTLTQDYKSLQLREPTDPLDRSPLSHYSKTLMGNFFMVRECSHCTTAISNAYQYGKHWHIREQRWVVCWLGRRPKTSARDDQLKTAANRTQLCCTTCTSVQTWMKLIFKAFMRQLTFHMGISLTAQLVLGQRRHVQTLCNQQGLT
jgi:hypothetical protein